MSKASRDPVPLSKIAIIDEETIQQIVEEIPPTGLTIEEIKADSDISDAISKKHYNTNDLSSEQKTALTGGNETNLHSHAGGSGGLTQAQILTRQL